MFGGNFRRIVILVLCMGLGVACAPAPPATGQHAIASPFSAPVITTDFPDPGVLVVGATVYAFATNANGKHVQVARSADLLHWSQLPDALPTLPLWVAADANDIWAPEVLELNDHFLMYYTAHDRVSGRQCIGLASSSTPAGPYRDARQAPLICQVGQGGTIDASPLRLGNDLYLYFKNDGNCCGQHTQLWASRLTADGQSLTTSPTSLVANDQLWEGLVIEAPSMVAHNGAYDLFYSANDYHTDTYAIGYARCSTPLGPCHKADELPWLKTDRLTLDPGLGPGGQCIFQFRGQTWMAYHTWNSTATGQRGNTRVMRINRLSWSNAVPVIGPE